MADFSFVVPIYKVPYDMLRECVDSLTNQTYREVEIVLVDDGSPDDCGKICDELAGLDSRIKVVHKRNGGAASARNAGLAVCNSLWVTFVDGDDWVDSDFVESFLNRIRKQEKKADFYIYNGYRNNSDAEVVKAPYYEDGKRFESYSERESLQIQCFRGPAEEKRKDMLFIDSPWAKVYCRDFLNKNELTFMDIPYSEGCVFFLYAVEKAQTVEYVSKPVYHYRYFKDSTVNQYAPNADKEQTLLLEKIFEFSERFGKTESFKNNIYLRVFQSMRRCLLKKYYHESNPRKGLARFLECERFFRQKPYRDVYRRLKFFELAKRNRILYILLRLKLYGVFITLRDLYRKKRRR